MGTGTDYATSGAGFLVYVDAQNSGRFVALNQATGSVETFGTDATVVIQAAIDGLGTTGGTVALGAGTFTLSRQGTVTGDSLTQPYCLRRASDVPLILRGAGAGATKLFLTAAQTINTAMFLARGSSTVPHTAPLLIEGIEFDGNSANQTGSWDDFGLVTASYAENASVNRCLFRNAKMFSVHPLRLSRNFSLTNSHLIASTSTSGGAVFFEVPGAEISGNHFVGTDTGGGTLLTLGCNADITTPGEWVRCINNDFKSGPLQLSVSGCWQFMVLGNSFHDVLNDNGVAIQVEAFNHATNDFDSKDGIIAGNTLYSVRQGIFLNAFDATYGCKRVIVRDNILQDSPSVNFVNGIQETGTAAGHVGNVIEGNIIGGTSGTALTVIGSTSVARNNRYGAVGSEKPTQATGTAKLLNGQTSIAVTHGLATTPTRVLVTPTVDPKSKFYWITSKGSTTFTITASADPTADVDFDWYAEV